MKYTSIFEKLFSLISVANTSLVNVIFLGIILFLIFLFSRKKISKKVCFIFSFISTLLLIGYVILNNLTVLGKVGDSIMDDFFTNIYFPSTYFYLFVLIFMNIAIVGSLINIRHKSSYKTINGIFLIIIDFLFALILELISVNKVDIFKKVSLFSNKNLIILLELSVIVFVFWLLSLAVVYLSSVLSERILLKREKKELASDTLKNTANVSNLVLEDVALNQESKEPVLKEVNVNKVEESVNEAPSYQFIPTMPRHFENTENSSWNKQMMIEQMLQQEENTSVAVPFSSDELHLNKEVQASFDLSSFVPREQEKKVIVPHASEANGSVLDQILNNSLPYVQEESKSREVFNEKNTYTLNDYRIFNKMLKDIREHNQSNSVVIDKDLEYRLITKYSTETYHLFQRMLKNYSAN